MPTKTGFNRPRGKLGLTSDVPAAVMKTKPPASTRVTSASVKSPKPPANQVGRRDKP